MPGGAPGDGAVEGGVKLHAGNTGAARAGPVETGRAIRNRAEFRFYEELNDFLPPARRRATFVLPFDGSPAVKDPIEAIGVPHSEVDLVVVNGRSVRFDYRLRDGDRVAVYPCFESLDISPVQRLRPAPLRRTAFILDVHLGKLARLLRLLGFDAAYRNDYGDGEIVKTAARDRRIILTRDRGLLFHKEVTHGLFVRATDPVAQAREVVARCDLRGGIRPFARCMACNGVLRPADKADVEPWLPPRTKRIHSAFTRCEACGAVYWKGSHYDRLVERIARIARAGD